MNETKALEILKNCVRSVSVNLVPFEKVEKEFRNHGGGHNAYRFGLGGHKFKKNQSHEACIWAKDREIYNCPYPENMSAWVAEQLGYSPATTTWEHDESVTVFISSRQDFYGPSGHWMDYKTKTLNSWKFPNLRTAWDWLLRVTA